MRDTEVHLPCECGGDIVTHIQVSSFGCPATVEAPPEGAEWSLIDAICDHCGVRFDEPEIASAHEARIQEHIAEWDRDREPHAYDSFETGGSAR